MKFLRKSLVLKIHRNAGQTLGTTTEGKKKKYGLVLRGPLLTVILNFSLSIKKAFGGG